MYLKIIEYSILVQVLGKSIEKDLITEAKTSLFFSLWYSYCFHGYDQKEVNHTHTLLLNES